MNTDHVYRNKKSSILGRPYRCAFYIWRHLPDSWRGAFLKNPISRIVKVQGRNVLAKFAGREDLYSSEYYKYVDAEALKSARQIVSSAINEFHPKTVIDVGCGTGALIAEFKQRGVEPSGLEYSKPALEICLKRGLKVRAFDIESDVLNGSEKFDLTVCFEVAEHLSASYADRLVDLLTSFSPRIMFTAATPGQGGGADHVNEQPHEYWIAKFERRGYKIMPEVTQSWRKEWNQAGVSGFYANNIMVFKKQG